MKRYSPKIEKLLITTRYADPKQYESRRQAKETSTELKSDGAFTMSLFDTAVEPPAIKVIETPVILATDSYEDSGLTFDEPIKEHLKMIVPRSEKAKEEQKARTKAKAEVFTPSWVCNLQNNLIDEATDYLLTPFNKTEGTEWSPTPGKIKFKENSDWLRYIIEPRLEITCGEAPYLFSRYDTVTGQDIPVRDDDGLYRRIGILDRKLRIVSENAEEDEWTEIALAAAAATYGYEWQGDNLILARSNMIETFKDYYKDFFKKECPTPIVNKIAEIASWNIWQMDGLKQVIPMSCSSDCKACSDKSFSKHDGKKAVYRSMVRDGFEISAFEEAGSLLS